MMTTISDLLSRFSLAITGSSPNGSPDQDKALIAHLGQTKIVSIGSPNAQNSMPGIIVFIHSSDNNAGTSLLLQVIQTTYARIFGVSDPAPTSPFRLEEGISSPLPDWGFYDEDALRIRGLESPTFITFRTTRPPFHSTSEAFPPKLKKSLGSVVDLLAPLARYPHQEFSPKTTGFLNKDAR